MSARDGRQSGMTYRPHPPFSDDRWVVSARCGSFRARHRTEAVAMFHAIGRFAATHPWIVCLGWVAAACLLTLVAPTWDSRTQDDDIRFLPDRCPSVRGYQLMQQAFPDDVFASRLVFAVEREESAAHRRRLRAWSSSWSKIWTSCATTSRSCRSANLAPAATASLALASPATDKRCTLIQVPARHALPGPANAGRRGPHQGSAAAAAAGAKARVRGAAEAVRHRLGGHRPRPRHRRRRKPRRHHAGHHRPGDHRSAAGLPGAAAGPGAPGDHRRLGLGGDGYAGPDDAACPACTWSTSARCSPSSSSTARAPITACSSSAATAKSCTAGQPVPTRLGLERRRGRRRHWRPVPAR